MIRGLFKRLVRFLARDEIEAAEHATRYEKRMREEAEAEKVKSAQFAYVAASQVEMAERLAFARGELAGQQRMADCILAAVQARMGGADDLVQVADVEAAKKGLIH